MFRYLAKISSRRHNSPLEGKELNNTFPFHLVISIHKIVIVTVLEHFFIVNFNFLSVVMLKMNEIFLKDILMNSTILSGSIFSSG